MGRLLSCQRSALLVIVDKVRRLRSRLAVLDVFDQGPEALEKIIGSMAEDGAKPSSKLVADDCDLLPSAGLVCPLKYISSEHRSIVTDDTKLFPSPIPGLDKFANIKGDDRPEYIRLVVRQLRTGKVELRRDVKAGGTVFGVAKKGSKKVREVWDGSRVSDVCVPPPPPPMLATPCSFPRIEVAHGKKLLLSKKDCRCFFDQLRLPEAVRLWTGRPPVGIDELIQIGGMSRSELVDLLPQFARLRTGDIFFPVSRVWCMGFAWSSFIAQSTLLACCRKAGLRDAMCICDSQPTPDVSTEAFALATDDVMHFTTIGPHVAERRMADLDQALLNEGIEKHPKKDEVAVETGTCIGVDLFEGSFFCAHAPKLALLLAAILEIIRRGECSPKGYHAVIGVAQWMFLLNRPSFSILDSSYAFTRLTPELEVRPLGHAEIKELTLILGLAPYFEADLRRVWAPMLTATDASSEFGFGACVAPCTQDVARQVGRLAEIRGAYIRLTRDGGPTDEPERQRLGQPHRLHLSKRAFKDVLSMRHRYKAHAGSLEASGLLLLLRWISRTPKHHSRRVPILVDAQAVLGAAAKGRTSANSFKRDMQRIAAVTLASDILPAYVYIPSEENPADAPSRGVLKPRAKIGKGLTKLPVRKRVTKVSNQMRGLPKWRTSSDHVADFLQRSGSAEKKMFEGLFDQLDAGALPFLD